MRAILIIALLLVLLVDIGTAMLVEKYEINAYSSEEQIEQHRNTPIEGPFILGTKTAILWFLDFVERNDKAIIALSTVAIALFTFTLWRSTNQLKIIAEKQIDALTSLERPWLFISGTHIKRRENIDEQIIPNYYWISFMCKNVGRAPAIVEECFIKIQDVKTLPKLPDYSAPIHHLRCPATVSVGDEFETSVIGPPSQAGVDSNKATEFAIYGCLTYKELNGKQHHSRFAVQVSPMMAAAIPYFNNAYDGYD